MILTTKARYAVMTVIAIAMKNSSKAVSLYDLSMSQGISVQYLEQIFSKLKSYGIVMSIRGSSGGYVLSKHPSEITMKNIIDAVDENIKMTRCQGIIDSTSGCMNNGAICNAHHLWLGLTKEIDKYLSSITISDAIKNFDLARGVYLSNTGILNTSEEGKKYAS